MEVIQGLLCEGDNKLKQLIIVIIISLIVTACETVSNDDGFLSEEEGLTRTLTIELVERHQGSDNRLYQKIMQFAEEHPEIEVTVRRILNAKEKLTPWMLDGTANGEPPDLIELTPNQMKLWFHHNKLEPLSLQDPEYRDYLITSAEGYVIGMKTKINPLIVYYNEDSFQQVGLEPPSAGWDWIEFDHAISTLKAAGMNVYMLMSPEVLEWLTINRYGGQIVDISGTEFGGYFDSDEVVQAAEWLAWVDTKYEDYRNRGTEQRPEYIPMPYDLIEDNMALAVDYAYYIQTTGVNNYETIINRNGRIGIAPLPGGTNVINPAMMSGLSVHAGGRNKEAAMMLIRYLLEESDDFYQDTVMQTHQTSTKEGFPAMDRWSVVMQEAKRSVPASLIMYEDQIHWRNKDFFPLHRALSSGQSAKEALNRYAEEIDLQFGDFKRDLSAYSACIKQGIGVCFW